MERFRAGEAMLRSTHSLWFYSAPTTYQRIAQPMKRHCRSQRNNASRAFTTTQFRKQDEAPRPSQNGKSARDEISSLLDSTLDLDKASPGVSPSRTSTFKSRSAQTANSPSRSIAQQVAQARSENRSSLDDVLNTMVKKEVSNTRSRSGPSRYTGTSISDMFGVTSFSQPGPSEREQRESEPARMPPNVGRLVQIDSSRDMHVGRAFKTMEILCARNQIRRQFMMQRFHERPGMKRKRLKRERWTKRFKANFQATVSMVQRMKKQGW